MKLIASWSDQIAQIHSVLLIRRAILLVNSVLKINLKTIIMPIFSSHFSMTGLGYKKNSDQEVF